MSVILKRRAVQLAAITATTGAVVLSTFAPAQAALPVWPTSGYRPTCDVVLAQPGPPSGTSWSYYDNTKPKITGFVQTGIIRVGNSPTAPTRLFTIYGTDTCSGVGTYSVVVAKNGAVIDILPVTQSRGSSFNGSGSYYGSLTPSDIGKLTYPSMQALDRFTEFDLSGDYKLLLSSTLQTPSRTTVSTTDAYRNNATFVMRDVRSTVAVNKTSIRKGAKVYVGGKFTRATGSSYVNLVGARIMLQRRDRGSTKWVNVVSAKTNSSGNVSIGSAPSKTADFRLNYVGYFFSPFYAPSVTGSKRVTVT